MPQQRTSTTRTLANGNRVTISVGGGRRGTYKTVTVKRPDGTSDSRTYRRGSFLTYLLGAYNRSVPSWAGGTSTNTQSQRSAKPGRVSAARLPKQAGHVKTEIMKPTSPRERSQRIVSPPNHDPGWKTLYLASEICRGLDEYQSDYQDYVIGFVRPSGEEFSTPLDAVQFLTRELRVNVQNLGRLFSREVIGQALASEDEGMIARIAADVVEVYARMIAWGNRVRNATVPDEWRPAFSALSRFVSTPLRQVQEFAKEYAEIAGRKVSAINEGRAPEQIQRTLKIELDAAATADFQQELHRLTSGTT